MAKVFEQLQRRNVIKVGATYVVAAWVLLQVVDLLAPALGWPDSVTRITLYLLLVGFPIALVLSWFYEITADGISLDEDSDTAGTHSQTGNRRLNLIATALLCAAVILFAYDKWWPDEVSDPSVAVLPFVNMSGLEQNEYFSDGLTETLLHVLAQNSELRVASRTSIFALKGKNRDIRDIALDLGVAHVLEGSVQRDGDKVRITAQLIRASDGSHLWSAKYDRTYDDIFAIHDEIAAAVGRELSNSLLVAGPTTSPEGLTTRNIEAFDLYLQALPEMATASYSSFQKAEELLKSALAKDPGFTDAKLRLAENFVSRGDTGAMAMDAALANATRLFEQVLAEQPGNVTARSFMVRLKLYEELTAGNLAARSNAVEQLFELVREAPANITARLHLGHILGSRDNDAALEQFRIAADLDPLNPYPHEKLAQVYMAMRDWASARKELRRSLELQPLQPNIELLFAAVSRGAGDAVELISHLQKGIQMDPLDQDIPFQIAELLYELELIDAGDRFRSQVESISPTSPVVPTLEIVRAIRADSEAESLLVARRMIRNDVDNRHNAWHRAFRHLMHTAVMRGRTADEFAFISEYVPGLADFDNGTVPWKAGVARAQSLEIWRDMDSDDGVLQRINAVLQAFDDIQLGVEKVPVVNIDILLLRGEFEAAVHAALNDLFSHSVLEHLDIKDRFATPLYADFVEDPRIAAALQRWDDELVQARENVRQYLADQ